MWHPRATLPETPPESCMSISGNVRRMGRATGSSRRARKATAPSAPPSALLSSPANEARIWRLSASEVTRVNGWPQSWLVTTTDLSPRRSSTGGFVWVAASVLRFTRSMQSSSSSGTADGSWGLPSSGSASQAHDLSGARGRAGGSSSTGPSRAGEGSLCVGLDGGLAADRGGSCTVDSLGRAVLGREGAAVWGRLGRLARFGGGVGVTTGGRGDGAAEIGRRTGADFRRTGRTGGGMWGFGGDGGGRVGIERTGPDLGRGRTTCEGSRVQCTYCSRGTTP
mmetsp:Transcript_41205/g.73898  ORF Transcript_41205/g.73898 Transcript_41205/m.73898 type:complete len:281 (-) Transcript_41205:586-1428(-)